MEFECQGGSDAVSTLASMLRISGYPTGSCSLAVTGGTPLLTKRFIYHRNLCQPHDALLLLNIKLEACTILSQNKISCIVLHKKSPSITLGVSPIWYTFGLVMGIRYTQRKYQERVRGASFPLESSAATILFAPAIVAVPPLAKQPQGIVRPADSGLVTIIPAI